jgi:LPXTG-motif cell wall-anchored protein
LYKLLDSGQYVSDDITEFKLKSRTSEVTVPISRMRVGMEANGTINFWLSKCPKVEQPQKEAPPQIKTEISLDLKGSYEHYSKIYLKIKGEWKEFTLHKKSSKFYLILKGRVKIEDITEVKCITLDNKEIIINVSKLKIKAKSTKNIELTLKQSPKSKSTVKHTQIHLHLQKCAKDFSKVYVQLNGKWVELNHQGKSPLYKLLDQGLYVKDDITSFKLVTKTGAEVVVPVSQLKVGVEANGTINYWLLICPKIDKPVEGGTNPPVKDEDKKPKPPKNNDPKPQPQKNPGSKSGEPVTTSDGTDQPKGPIPTTIDNNGSESETPTTGSLPQTGESSSAWYYILGFILIALGAILVNLKSGRK